MKLNIKRIISLFLLAVLIFCSMSGCGREHKKTASAGTVKKIVMWKFKSNKEDYILYDWIKQWNAQHPNVQASLELIPFTDYLENKLPTAFATNSAPDIYMISAGSFLKYAKAGCMLALDGYINGQLKKDFYQSSLETTSYNGHIMGIPIEREPVALFYNKKVFQQKGISPPRSWEELLHCAKVLNSESMSGIYLPVQPNDYQNFIFYSFLFQVSDGVIEKGYRSAAFQSSGYRALELWRDLSPYDYKLETAVQLAPDIYPLASGKTAMQICGYWAVRMLAKYYPQFEYGIVPVPVAINGRVRSVYGGWYQVINPDSKFKDAAVAFSLWMWGSDPVRPIAWCTQASTKFPARSSVMKLDEKLFNDDQSKVFKENILPFAIPEPRYPSEISGAVSKAIQAAMFTDKPIPNIAAKADEEINNYLRLNPVNF